MGGMDEMGVFYDECAPRPPTCTSCSLDQNCTSRCMSWCGVAGLEELYPAGSCGTFCNAHTYDCYLAEIQQACCDEEGTNCRPESDVPNTCPVGCAIVFPEFLEACREHVETNALSDPTMVPADFEAFEQQCLDSDGLALVEYALQLAARGCIITLDDSAGGQHRRLQNFLTNWMSSSAQTCTWDELDDLATDVDMICCGADRSNCPEGSQVPHACSAGCAVSMHQFVNSCGVTMLNTLSDDSRYQSIMAFEQSCLDSADPLLFLTAIESAQCDGHAPAPQPPPPPPSPPSPPPPPRPPTPPMTQIA